MGKKKATLSSPKDRLQTELQELINRYFSGPLQSMSEAEALHVVVDVIDGIASGHRMRLEELAE